MPAAVEVATQMLVMILVIKNNFCCTRMNHLHVVSITSDGASSNRKLYRISDANDLTVPYKIENSVR